MILSTRNLRKFDNTAPLLRGMEPFTYRNQGGHGLVLVSPSGPCFVYYFAKELEETMKFARSPLIHGICLITLLSSFFPPITRAQATSETEIILIAPFPGTTAVSKSPHISFKSSGKLLAEGRLVLLDGNDVSALVAETNNVYSFTPMTSLPAGEHNLYIAAYTEDGSMVEKEFFFTSRHSESFEEVYSNNRVSATLRTALRREYRVPESSFSGGSESPQNNFPYTTLDSYVSSESGLKEDKWDTSLRANLRYYDQNANLMAPEKKGLSLLDFLITAHYTEDTFSALMEIGDTTIEESTNTIDYLTRRGGKASISMGNITLNGFGVLGRGNRLRN